VGRVGRGVYLLPPHSPAIRTYCTSSTMDPISIAATAATIAQQCIRVSSFLYSFIRCGTNIDETVTVLSTEVESLQRNLTAIAESCRLPSVRSAAQNSEEQAHWDTLEQSLNDCKDTLETLERSLASVQSTRARKGGKFVNFISKRITWDSTSQELFRIRQKVTAYRETIGLSLQWISLYVFVICESSLT